MSEKRFQVHQMIRDYTTSEDIDFDFLQELINEHTQPKDLTMHITDYGKPMTYRECETLLNQLFEDNNRLEKENRKLKSQLEDTIHTCVIYKKANMTFDDVYQKNEELVKKIDMLSETLAYRSNQAAYADYLINDLGSPEMMRQWEEFTDD